MKLSNSKMKHIFAFRAFRFSLGEGLGGELFVILSWQNVVILLLSLAVIVVDDMES